MGEREHAVLEQHDGRQALRFERTLSHPRQRVWQALSGGEELRRWHPTPFELEPAAAGGRIRYRPAAHIGELPDGRVLEYEPPRLLAYTWWEDELRFELQEREGGCVLTLTHSFDDRLKAARDAAGWHLCLEALSASVAGRGHAPAGGVSAYPPEGWAELNEGYQRRFGIAVEQATPPPSA